MVDQQAGSRTAMWVPAYYLLGHGLELAFKAFLLTKHQTLQQTRSLNHNLVTALDACQAEGLSNIVQLVPEDVSHIEQLNSLYNAKELEYIVTGARRVPSFPVLQGIAVKIYKGVAAQTEWRGSLDRWIS